MDALKENTISIIGGDIMGKLYKVRCEVNMDRENIVEVIVVANFSHRAINIAKNQLKDEGYSYIYPVSCKEA